MAVRLKIAGLLAGVLLALVGAGVENNSGNGSNSVSITACGGNLTCAGNTVTDSQNPSYNSVTITGGAGALSNGSSLLAFSLLSHSSATNGYTANVDNAPANIFSFLSGGNAQSTIDINGNYIFPRAQGAPFIESDATAAPLLFKSAAVGVRTAFDFQNLGDGTNGVLGPGSFLVRARKNVGSVLTDMFTVDSGGAGVFNNGLTLNGASFTIGGTNPTISTLSTTVGLGLSVANAAADGYGTSMSAASLTASADNPALVPAGGVASLAQPAGANTNLLAILDGGTSCTSATQCFSDLRATAAGQLTLNINTAANTNGLIINQRTTAPGACTAGQGIFIVQKEGSNQLKVQCNGNVILPGVLELSSTSANVIRSDTTGANAAVQVIATAGPTSDLLQVCLTNCTTPKLTVSNNGDIAPRHYNQIAANSTGCADSISSAGTNGAGCAIGAAFTGTPQILASFQGNPGNAESVWCTISGSTLTAHVSLAITNTTTVWCEAHGNPN